LSEKLSVDLVVHFYCDPGWPLEVGEVELFGSLANHESITGCATRAPRASHIATLSCPAIRAHGACDVSVWAI
jgi:hypothetical protein